MIDSFPYDSWLNAEGSLNTDITTFWTFGPAFGADGGSLTGTYVLTALGMLLMVAALVYYVVLERSKLRRQAEYLRGAGGAPAPGPADPRP
jgi:hypothetical protein